MNAAANSGDLALATSREREFLFTERDFRTLSALAGRHAGIHMPDAKRELIYGRLARRLRQLGLSRFEEYCELLESGDMEEIERFTNAITTNLTYFYREPHHFEFIRRELVPKWRGEAKGGREQIRVWCAGCSTGEEPYSVAMTLLDGLGTDLKISILATDLDSHVLDTASRGIYPLDRVSAVSPQQLKRWFLRGKGRNEGLVRVRPELRRNLRFLRHNLVFGGAPNGAPFDVIFCRNVVIYFERPVQDAVFNRFAECLKPDGTLFVGHSESLFGKTERFRLIGQSTYRRLG